MYVAISATAAKQAAPFPSRSVWARKALAPCPLFHRLLAHRAVLYRLTVRAEHEVIQNEVTFVSLRLWAARRRHQIHTALGCRDDVLPATVVRVRQQCLELTALGFQVVKHRNRRILVALVGPFHGHMRYYLYLTLWITRLGHLGLIPLAGRRGSTFRERSSACSCLSSDQKLLSRTNIL